MDHERFLALIAKRAADSRSRRSSVRLVGAAALAGLFGFAGGSPPSRAADCLKVDKPCRRASQCCSGLCRGKRGEKTCRAHGDGTCRRGQGVCAAPNPEALTCGDDVNCFCIVTTAGNSFCGNLSGANFRCAACARDAECVALGFPTGAACVPMTAGTCAGQCVGTGGRACVAPCGTPPGP